jgi:predicted transposase YdaD
MPYITSIEQMALEEGQVKERQTIARNMLKANMSLEQIASLTGLTIEQIQLLQSNPQDN